MAARFQRGLQRTRNTPPQASGKTTVEAKEAGWAYLILPSFNSQKPARSSGAPSRGHAMPFRLYDDQADIIVGEQQSVARPERVKRNDEFGLVLSHLQGRGPLQRTSFVIYSPQDKTGLPLPRLKMIMAFVQKL